MFKLIKRLFRWAFYLLILAVVLMVVAILSLDAIAKQIVESRFRSETGMDATIGKMDVGLLTPTLAIEDLKIYNPPDFGGSLFLSIPEIYVDYDRAALRARKLHLNLVRINLAEMDVIQDNKGHANIESIGNKSQAAVEAVKKQTSAFAFTGLDTLNVTFQKLRLWSLDSPAQAREVPFGITNEVFTNLKTGEDFQRMAVLLAARSSASAPPLTNAPIDLMKLLQPLWHPGAKK